MPYQFNRRQFLVGGASLTVIAGLSACGVQSGSSPTPGSARPMSGADNVPVNLNPVYAQSLQITSLQTSGKQPVGYPSAYEAAFAVYAGLVRFSRTMTFEPDLATKWGTSKDGLEWTFTLRSAVKFHDGTDFDADAVVSYFTSMLDKNVNLAAYNLWSHIASVTKTDDMTVVVKTTKPYGALLNTMAHGSALIPSPQSVRQFGADIGLHPVGAGPYQLTKFDPGASLVVKRHDGYYGDKPVYDSITYLYVGDASGRVSALQTNRAQLIDAVPVEQVDTLGADSSVKVIDDAALQVFGIGLNFTNTVLQEKTVRQAMNYAIDKAALISTIFRGHATVLNSPLAPATTGYVKCGSYDVAVETPQLPAAYSGRHVPQRRSGRAGHPSASQGDRYRGHHRQGRQGRFLGLDQSAPGQGRLRPGVVRLQPVARQRCPRTRRALPDEPRRCNDRAPVELQLVLQLRR